MAWMSAAGPVLADIYAWTDENGVRHYSDSPPGDANVVAVTPEIPHDHEADRKNREAHQAMMKAIEQEQRASENRELEKRLKKNEKKIQEAERKAAQALDQAKEARDIAVEKQRRREVYVVPWIGPRNKRPVPYDPYGTPSSPHGH
jgi:hypothetical protein